MGAGHVRVHRRQPAADPDVLHVPSAVGHHRARTSSFPSIYGGASSAAVLLIIAIVGTTVAPWQLFFQQSNIVDKRITPRFISYERADTVIGSLVVVAGAAAIMVTANYAASGTPAFGHFTDALGVADLLKAQEPGPRGHLRHRPLRRQHHRRCRGHPLHQLRLRGRVRDPPLPAPGLQGGQAVLPELHRHGRRRRRASCSSRAPRSA